MVSPAATTTRPSGLVGAGCRASTALPLYVETFMMKPPAFAERFKTPAVGEVQAYQTVYNNIPPALPVYSPGSVPAPEVVPWTVRLVPVNAVRFANMSFAGWLRAATVIMASAIATRTVCPWNNLKETLMG